MASLFKRSNGIYYYVTSRHGRRVWYSTGTSSKAEALNFRPDQDSNKPHSQNLSLAHFTDHFLQYARVNFAPTTVVLYKQAITTFARLAGNFPISSYTTMDVESFKIKRSAEVSPVKVNIDFRTVRAFFQTAVRWKLIRENPFKDVKQLRVPAKHPVYVSKDEFKQLLDSITFPWFKNLVIFAVCTMMRCGEIVSLSWDSVDLRRKVILIQNTINFRVKSGKPRTVPMNDWVFGYLATRERKGSNVFIFPDGKPLTVSYVSRRFKKFLIKSGLNSDIHFHSLRHTGASWLVQSGVSIYAVQKLLGHSNITVTQVYSHLESESLFHSVEKISMNINQKVLYNSEVEPK